ncbi:MAG: glycosyltransferase family 4 protein [Pseudomonadota bacterium]
MRNIIFVRDSHGQPLGGIEGKILLIAKDLYRRRIYEAVLLTGDQHSAFSRQFAALGFPVHELPIRGLGALRSCRSRVRDILARYRYNVALIQSHHYRESIAARLVRRDFPQIRHVARIHTHIDGHGTPFLSRTMYHLLDWSTSLWVDAFVPISNHLVLELTRRSWIPRDKVHVVPNGIPAIAPPDLLCTAQAELAPAAAIIGDLEMRKQQHFAVESIGLLHQMGLEVHLHLIGRDRKDRWSNADLVKRKASSMGVNHLVHLHGYQPNDAIGELLHAVPIVLLPSLFEGIPTSIIEGMSMRKLVIATPVGGTGELIEDGVNGFLHNPYDPQALAEILKTVLVSPGSRWNEIRENGYQTWKRRYSLDVMMEGLIKVYERLGAL